MVGAKRQVGATLQLLLQAAQVGAVGDIAYHGFFSVVSSLFLVRGRSCSPFVRIGGQDFSQPVHIGITAHPHEFGLVCV